MVFLINETFTEAKPGPARILRPALPNEPKGGFRKALVSNQRSGVGWERWGWPTTLGRSTTPNPILGRPVLLLSTPGRRVTVNGRPVWKVHTPLVCQPRRRMFLVGTGRS